MKVLVFGFSVTGDTAGYVEKWQADYGQENGTFEIIKVAIGGLQPYSARHLLSTILDRHKPDALIVEIATAVTRNFKESGQQIQDHTDTVTAAFSCCKARGIICGFLDLPLMGSTPALDWMSRLHHAECARYSVPRVLVEHEEDTLKDIVHPNEKGKAIYAAALHRLLMAMAVSRQDFSALVARRAFGAFPLEEVRVTGGVMRDFVRSGFVASAVSIAAGETITVELPRKVTVSGAMMLMGPLSGTLVVRFDDRSQSVRCYDRHCYYERMGGMRLHPAATTSLSLTQTADMPDVELVKGDKDFSERIGVLTHVLYEE